MNLRSQKKNKKDKPLKTIWEKKEFRISPGDCTSNWSSKKEKGGCWWEVESSKKDIFPGPKEVCFQVEMNALNEWKILSQKGT